MRESRACYHQHAGGGVVGGAGESGHGHVADGDAIAGQVGYNRSSFGPGSPVFSGSQVVGRATRRTGSSFVQELVGGSEVGGTEQDRERSA